MNSLTLEALGRKCDACMTVPGRGCGAVGAAAVLAAAPSRMHLPEFREHRLVARAVAAAVLRLGCC